MGHVLYMRDVYMMLHVMFTGVCATTVSSDKRKGVEHRPKRQTGHISSGKAAQ